MRISLITQRAVPRKGTEDRQYEIVCNQLKTTRKKRIRRKKQPLMTALTDSLIVGCLICNWTKYKKDNRLCIYAVNYMQLVLFVSTEWNATPPILKYIQVVTLVLWKLIRFMRIMHIYCNSFYWFQLLWIVINGFVNI